MRIWKNQTYQHRCEKSCICTFNMWFEEKRSHILPCLASSLRSNQFSVPTSKTFKLLNLSCFCLSSSELWLSWGFSNRFMIIWWRYLRNRSLAMLSLHLASYWLPFPFIVSYSSSKLTRVRVEHGIDLFLFLCDHYWFYLHRFRFHLKQYNSSFVVWP